jgi:Spy/CpxP family protein refolding chaperone
VRPKKLLAAIALALLCVFRAAPAPAEPAPGDDPLARFVFPPEKVLGHAQEIGLDDGQRRSIKAELQKAQARFLDLQFEMQPEAEKMAQLLQEKPADEAKVLAQADKVMALEREVKRTHLALLIRIRNLLTPAQQAKMGELQRAEGK